MPRLDARLPFSSFSLSPSARAARYHHYAISFDIDTTLRLFSPFGSHAALFSILSPDVFALIRHDALYFSCFHCLMMMLDRFSCRPLFRFAFHSLILRLLPRRAISPDTPMFRRSDVSRSPRLSPDFHAPFPSPVLPDYC